MLPTFENPAESTAPKEAPPKDELREFIKTVLIAVLLAVVFRSFAYEPFHIPSGSMKSGLLVGDYLFVSKPAYGYSRYSFPFAAAPIKGRLFAHAPERGDVVVFRLPRDTRIDYIKRLIGLPGDRIQVKQGVLYINDVAVKKEYVDDFLDTEKPDQAAHIKRYRETLPNGRSYLVLDQTQFGEMDNTPVYIVPEGHYFMMGDNRDNSTDSRYLDQVGYVPFENFVGRAERIGFSTDGSARFWEVWKWPSTLRTERALQPIQ